jgi:hypothetical protein
MVLPQYSLRMILGLMAVLGFVSLIVSRGLQGSGWALGVSVAFVALIFVFLAYGAFFGIIYLVSRPFQRQDVSRQLGGAPASPAQTGAASAPRDNTDLMPPLAGSA